jgi:hypothetical protein
MMQVGTLLFGGAFPVLTKPDIILITISYIFPLPGYNSINNKVFSKQRGSRWC